MSVAKKWYDNVVIATSYIGPMMSTTDINEPSENLVDDFQLFQNYPNPFNPTTKIKFTIPSVETSRWDVFTTLKVYDILGNEVATLVNEEKPAGSYEIDFDGTKISSGVYIYKLNAGLFTDAKKMILLK